MSDLTFADLFREAKKSDAYWTEGAILAFTEEMVQAMDRRGLTRADLARKLDTSPAYITKILRGDNNFTLATMTRIARALGLNLHLHLSPQEATTRWMDAYKGAKSASAARKAPEDVGRKLTRYTHEQHLRLVTTTGSDDDVHTSAAA